MKNGRTKRRRARGRGVTDADLRRMAKRKLVKVDDACERSGYSRSTLYRLLREKQIKGFHLGSRTLIDCNSVDAYKKRLGLAAWG